MYTNLEAQTQDLNVTGTITSAEDGLPIPGATVIIKGTTIGVISDFDGIYSIEAKTGDMLEFSFIGTESQSIAVTKAELNVILVAQAQSLEEVVVIGYGTIAKKDVTGSVASVDTKELAKTQTTSIAQAIQGRAPGVSVTKNSGQPGATPNVRIRGIGTVNNADPLYVVDGVPISDISNINMDDAKSIEVLKDASATAIYGSRGANGVVLIATKGGIKNTKPAISYKTYMGVENRIDNLDVMNASQWATLYNEGRVNDGNAPEPAFADPSSLPTYNWKDAVYRTGTIQNHQLSVSGANDKTSYRGQYLNSYL